MHWAAVAGRLCGLSAGDNQVVSMQAMDGLVPMAQAAKPWLLPVFCWLFALGWVWQAVERWRHREATAELGALPMAEVDAGDGPQMTVIVPACNEEDGIEATLRGLLASRGLRLQIVAVNDRSTDATGARMEAVAAEWAMQCAARQQEQEMADGEAFRHRLEVLHIAALPEGWLGKPHALAMGAERAQAEWILCTDGDVVFAEDALARALGWAQQERADHLAVLPEWVVTSRAERALQGAMFAMTGWTTRTWKVADPKARDFLGVGAFNLMRRSSYEALGGFAALRMEVLEDLRMGWRVKQAGMRQRVAWGQGMVRVRWANGAWGVVRNLEKNIFALFRYRLVLALAACVGVALQVCVPVAALVVGGSAWSVLGTGWGPDAWTLAAGLVTAAALLAVYAEQRRRVAVPVGYVLLFPVALAIFLFAMLRSIAMTLSRGGVVWRGTLYPLEKLRAAAGRGW